MWVFKLTFIEHIKKAPGNTKKALILTYIALRKYM